MSTATTVDTRTQARAALGYQIHTIGQFNFQRDEYFAHIKYPGGSHIIPSTLFCAV